MSDGVSLSEMNSAFSEPEDLWARDNYFHEDVNQHPAVREVRSVFGPAIVNVVRFSDETTIHVQPRYFRDLCDYLRTHEQLAFVALTDVTAVDMLKLRTTPRFDVVALLYSIKNRVRLRIKTGVNDGEAVPSLVPLWPGVNWLEREVLRHVRHHVRRSSESEAHSARG